jgi:hypothetical protein
MEAFNSDLVQRKTDFSRNRFIYCRIYYKRSSLSDHTGALKPRGRLSRNFRSHQPGRAPTLVDCRPGGILYIVSDGDTPNGARTGNLGSCTRLDPGDSEKV